MMDILPEPVDKWQDLNGTDLLQLIYENPTRWSAAQVNYTYDFNNLMGKYPVKCLVDKKPDSI